MKTRRSTVFVSQSTCCKKQQGLSLLEVLVAAIVAVIALLGLAMLELNLLRSSHSSFHYTASTIRVNNLIDEIWLDLCTASTNSATYDSIVTNWKNEVGADYVVAAGTPPDDFAYTFDIEVSWQDKRIDEADNNKVRLSAVFPEVCN